MTMTTTETVKIRFVPQVWVNDYAMEVDPLGETEFEVPVTDTKGLKTDSYESDELRFHANAPDWIKEWSGPFYIEIDNEW